MIAAVALLAAFPLGFLCRDPRVGYLAFVAAFAHVYTFQTAMLVMEWVNGNDSAFAQSSSEQLASSSLSYFAFTTLVYAVGLGLVRVGQLARSRRDRRRADALLAA